jgi:hypothetical protein
MYGGNNSISSDSSDSYDILKQGNYKFPKKRKHRFNEEDIAVKFFQLLIFGIMILIALSMGGNSSSRGYRSYYDENYRYSSSYDNDYSSWSSDDWSSDDWDSGYTDWDSDW